MPGYERFELRRRSDDLVYTFARKLDPQGVAAYQCLDLDLWIGFQPGSLIDANGQPRQRYVLQCAGR